MATYEIPLSPEAQTMSIALGTNTYELAVLWNGQAGAWMLSLADSSGNQILNNIPLLPGVDLFGPYAYLNLGGSLYAVSETASTLPLQYATLGITDHLYYVTP